MSLWDLKSGKQARQFPLPLAWRVHPVCWSADGRLLAVMEERRDEYVYSIVDLRTGEARPVPAFRWTQQPPRLSDDASPESFFIHVFQRWCEPDPNAVGRWFRPRGR